MNSKLSVSIVTASQTGSEKHKKSEIFLLKTGPVQVRGWTTIEPVWLIKRYFQYEFACCPPSRLKGLRPGDPLLHRNPLERIQSGLKKGFQLLTLDPSKALTNRLIISPQFIRKLTCLSFLISSTFLKKIRALAREARSRRKKNIFIFMNKCLSTVSESPYSCESWQCNVWVSSELLGLYRAGAFYDHVNIFKFVPFAFFCLLPREY